MKDLHAKKMTTNKKKKKEQYAFKTNKWYKLARFYNLLFVRYFDLKSPITSIYIYIYIFFFFLFKNKLFYNNDHDYSFSKYKTMSWKQFQAFDWKCFTCG
jgi:hypothetical protein